MKWPRSLAVVAIAVLFPAAAALSDSANLAVNGGFEDGMDGWKVEVQGDWARKIDRSQLVRISPDARTGRKALVIDTAELNPGGKITDELRYTRRGKYRIRVTREIEGIVPGAWYLAKFRVKSPGIAIDDGIELLSNIKPWPRKNRKDKNVRWLRTGRGKVFLPRAIREDDRYHEYILLKETYPSTDTLEVGVQIRAPWTGKIILDDVEVVRIEPDKDMDAMERYLGLRGTRPIRKVRELNRETTLVEGGRPTSAILIPNSPAYKRLGAKIQTQVKQLTGAVLPAVTKLRDVPPGHNIVALGSVVDSDLIARLHFNRYVKIDAAFPGPGGYVIWTVAEPYGLALKQNVVVVGGSDEAGQSAAVDDFCEMLAAEGNTIDLPFLHKVSPRKVIPPDERAVPVSTSSGKRTYGYRTTFGGFSKWFLNKWLETGDLEIAGMVREEILSIAAANEKDPYDQTEWDTFEVGFAWDSLEELPALSDADRLRITNLMLGYLCTRPQATSDWGTSFLMVDNPIWNHQAKGLSGVYTMGRYFNRFYGEHDPRFEYYLAAAHNAFRSQRSCSKPQENSGNYWQTTMKFCIAYYLGEWDMTFFENGALRRYAEYTAAVHNNKGWLSGFGDTYYCYHGASPFDIQKNRWSVPLGFWYYRDPRMLWWVKHTRPDYQNPYHRDVEPVEWKELVGVRKIPLDRGLYIPTGEKHPLWGAGGQYSNVPVGGVEYEETFDKISLRQNWDGEGDYMLIEGNGRGIHSQRATNQICKLSILGEDIVIGSTYKGSGSRTYSAVFVVKDAKIDDPAVKGDAQYPFMWWNPVSRGNLAYAALDAMADLRGSGFTRTSLPQHQGGTRWDRNVIWVKGKYFVMIDEVTPAGAGVYHIESNYATCPENRKGTFPPITKRTWRLLEDGRTFEVAYQTDSGLKQYICTDGTADLVIDPYKFRCEYIYKTMVRQQLVDRKLDAGEKATLITLFYGDKAGDRRNYRVERIGATEGLVFQGDRPVGYFGCGQGEKSRSVLPIAARMFLLTDETLTVVEGTSAGSYFKSEKPVSREVKLPAGTAAGILNALGRMTRR